MPNTHKLDNQCRSACCSSINNEQKLIQLNSDFVHLKEKEKYEVLSTTLQVMKFVGKGISCCTE